MDFLSTNELPIGSKALDTIQADLAEQLDIQVGQRNEEYLSFKVGGSDWFSIRITAERKNIGAIEFAPNGNQWNGRWKVELMMGSFGDRSKTWRPADDKIAEIIPKMLQMVRTWIEQDRNSNVVGP